MLKGRELRGLIVYAGLNREIAGRVSGVYVDEASGMIQGLALEASGLLQKTLYVDIRSVREISKAGVVVPNKKSLKRLPKGMESIAQKGWMGSRLLDGQGHDKGTVTDILVKNGAVAGLEISAGMMNDLQSRRDFLPWSQVKTENGLFTMGEDIYK